MNNVFCLLAVLVLASCGGPPIAAPDVGCEAVGWRGIPSAVVVFLFDNTGSQRPAVPYSDVYEDAARLVGHLPTPSLLVVRFLSDDSYRDAPNRALIKRIPPVAPAPLRPRNIYDPVQRRRFQEEELAYRRSLACVEQARSEIADALVRLEAPRAPASQSDIWGGLTRVAEHFDAFPPEVDRAVVLWSDVKHNLDRDLGPVADLPGASILLRTVRAGITGAQASEIESAFTRATEAAGASVSVSSMSVVDWAVVLESVGLFPSSQPATTNGGQ